jgi:sorting nexin-29
MTPMRKTPPTLEEVEKEIKKLKKHKAAETDNIPAELYKYGGNELVKHLHTIIKEIWLKEKMPTDWNSSIICPIQKLGDIMECSNYRGVSLLNTAYKILSNILFARISPFAENIVRIYQCGFRKNTSTTNQIFTLRQIMEKTKEFGIETHHLFIDFKSAYDTVRREQLYNAMSEFKIPHKLIRLTRMTMEHTKSQVRIQSDLSDPITTKKGLRQGDSLACLLFNLALEKVIRNAGIQTNGTIFYKSVQLLAYADDIDIIARSQAALKEAFISLERAAGEMGLKINEEKTKYLTTGVNKNKNQMKYCQIGNFNFESVQSFTYLGSLVNVNNDNFAEIKKRTLWANKSFYGLRRQFRSQFLSIKNKIKLYKTLIRPVLAYGSETWVLSDQCWHMVLRLGYYQTSAGI